MTASQVASAERMQCMEVWGGNSPVDRDIATVGLQVWLHSRPYEHAEKGGDVYYVSSCASGRITRLLLADVSGHGERVATLAGKLRDLMRHNINLISQLRFVREMNRQFSEQPSRTGFATALVCTFFAPTRSLQFCNAGHPAPMLYRAAEGRWASAEELASVDRGSGFSDTPLGVVEGADYSRFETKLAHGDMMLCVSDAFTESLNSEGKLFGADGLMQRVEALDASDPTQIIPQLLERIGLRTSRRTFWPLGEASPANLDGLDRSSLAHRPQDRSYGPLDRLEIYTVIAICWIGLQARAASAFPVYGCWRVRCEVEWRDTKNMCATPNAFFPRPPRKVTSLV